MSLQAARQNYSASPGASGANFHDTREPTRVSPVLFRALALHRRAQHFRRATLWDSRGRGARWSPRARHGGAT